MHEGNYGASFRVKWSRVKCAMISVVHREVSSRMFCSCVVRKTFEKVVIVKMTILIVRLSLRLCSIHFEKIGV